MRQSGWKLRREGHRGHRKLRVIIQWGGRDRKRSKIMEQFGEGGRHVVHQRWWGTSIIRVSPMISGIIHIVDGMNFNRRTPRKRKKHGR